MQCRRAATVRERFRLRSLTVAALLKDFQDPKTQSVPFVFPPFLTNIMMLSVSPVTVSVTRMVWFPVCPRTAVNVCWPLSTAVKV